MNRKQRRHNQERGEQRHRSGDLYRQPQSRAPTRIFKQRAVLLHSPAVRRKIEVAIVREGEKRHQHRRHEQDQGGERDHGGAESACEAVSKQSPPHATALCKRLRPTSAKAKPSVSSATASKITEAALAIG